MRDVRTSEIYRYFIIDKAHRANRRPVDENFAIAGLSAEERMCRRLERLVELEEPSFMPFEKIVMTRSTERAPDVFGAQEWAQIKKEHYIHELGYVSNLSPDYESAIRDGLLAKREGADEYGKRAIDAVISLCDKYLELAKREKREDLVEVFTHIPRYGARNFREALQFFRILHFALWLEGNYHNTVGRFDRYMYPYFEADMKAGVYTEEEALMLLEDFFISFNKDSDMYVGVQQGDNGQSMVLGGYDESGEECFNLLSKLCLAASRNLAVIDPKINLRVTKNTPMEVYRLGTELTRVGLGFPQYSNDDVVIPALIKLGYDPEDACNYVVAACWEFIIPGCGNDVANIGALNMPKTADCAIREALASGEGFDGLLLRLRDKIFEETRRIQAGVNNLWFVPSPFMDVLRRGKKYNNFGIHGTGIAPAADALAAVKRYVFDEGRVKAKRLITALDENFENDPELLHLLRYEAPKMGADGGEESVALAGVIMQSFSDACRGVKNCLGGIWRCGTGSAMYYLWHANELGATADGRRRGEPFGTNFSPSIFAKIEGPVSVVEAFSPKEIADNMNGGPLTLEFAGGVFRDEESIDKVASLVRYFISLGGHQLQLNAVNLEDMKRAQKNPELYRQLVVRIWGWSAYFVELDKCFQDHVMMRQEYTV